jgi:3-methylcrotonyl-CoA carboxylase alpha subunit
MFKSVLIANRGEIAVRIMAACQEMEIRTIAVYSEADAGALHVRLADQAYLIGPAPAQESYLNSTAILEAARRSGAEAIHPGYGFLAENAEFAASCADAGIVFIGPPAEAIRLMGSKTAAKRAVQEAGVPVVPGYDGVQRDLRTMQREAARIGYPVMIKASAGGGGKGMRVVHRRDELAEALSAAEREAHAAFGDESVFLEKLIPAPRHVEFQILADHYGCVIHLGERECSIQRRHQKIIEESPSVALDYELREAMGQAAIAAARSASYTNAGTCEFLLDADGTFYFLEMNTRLQVEHPVTEMVTGLDLVRLQLAIAAGLPLPVRQEEINFRGHAIEARLYAEDPANEYLPSTGRVSFFGPPQAPGIRVDAGVATGDEVSVYYDPMLAKLIVYGASREPVIERLRWALEHFQVLGMATNLALLRAIAGEDDFAAGQTSTAYLDIHDFSGQLSQPPVTPLVLAAAALWEELSPNSRSPAGPYNPWTSNVAASSRADRNFRYLYGSGEFVVRLSPVAMGAGYRVTINDKPFLAESEGGTDEEPIADDITATLSGENQLTLLLGAHRRLVAVARNGRDVQVSYSGQSYLLRKPRPLDVTSSAAAGFPGEQSAVRRYALTAPMAGTVIKVQVREGEQVTANQPLVILGAMKMEHSIRSPYPGHITRVPHVAGDVVSGGEVLVELDTGGGD